jgi:hypothetical protein
VLYQGLNSTRNKEGSNIMKKVNIKALFVAILASAIGFIIIEFFVEILFFRTFGISEDALYKYFNISPSGLLFQSINLLIFFLNISLIMSVYAAIRPRFSSDIIAAMVTSGLFVLLMTLFLLNLSNLGIYPLTISLTSIIFIIIELPFAVMIGAVTYTSRTGKK